jgi:hypothetical protein
MRCGERRRGWDFNPSLPVHISGLVGPMGFEPTNRGTNGLISLSNQVPSHMLGLPMKGTQWRVLLQTEHRLVWGHDL